MSTARDVTGSAGECKSAARPLSIIFPSGEIGPGSYGLSSEIRKHSSAVDGAVSLEASLDFFPPENT